MLTLTKNFVPNCSQTKRFSTRAKLQLPHFMEIPIYGTILRFSSLFVVILCILYHSVFAFEK